MELWSIALFHVNLYSPLEIFIFNLSETFDLLYDMFNGISHVIYTVETSTSKLLQKSWFLPACRIVLFRCFSWDNSNLLAISLIFVTIGEK